MKTRNEQKITLKPFHEWLKECGWSKSYGWRMRKRGMVQTVNIGGRHYISQIEIEEFLNRAEAGLFAKPPRVPEKPAQKGRCINGPPLLDAPRDLVGPPRLIGNPPPAPLPPLAGKPRPEPPPRLHGGPPEAPPKEHGPSLTLKIRSGSPARRQPKSSATGSQPASTETARKNFEPPL